MTDDPDTAAARRAIAALGRRAAAAGLRHDAAQELFAVLYDADAWMLAGGNASRAAEIAGLGWPGALRQRRVQRARARAKKGGEG